MISVIILTRNRLKLLIQLLEALRQQEFKEFETIVIDTGSRDGTVEWLRQCTAPPLKVLEFSPEQGGFAEVRNIGLKNAKGNTIAFIDDDCLPPADWLKKISTLLKDFDCIGGAVLPPPEVKFPRWWTTELNWLVGLTPPAEKDKKFPSGVYPTTANLALRRDVALQEPFQELKKTFGFAKSELSVYWAGREDAELWWRLRTKGYRLSFDPELFVYHYIPQGRFRLPYLLKRAFRDGYVFYLRQRQKDYLSVAIFQLYDVINRITRRWLKKERLIPALILELLWSIRQTGFLAGYLREEGDYLSVAKIAFARLADYASATAKIIARSVFVRGYRSLRPVRRIPLPLRGAVLLATSGFIGDFIIIQPAIRALRRVLPEAKLIFLCNEPGRQLYDIQNSPLPVDEIVSLPADKKSQKETLSHLLKRYNFSATLFFYYHRASCQPLFFHRQAPPTIGFNDDVGFPRRLWYDLLDLRVEKNFEQNEVLNHFRLVEKLVGSPLNNFIERYQLFIPTTIREKYKMPEEKLIVGINTGSALAEKRWQVEHWVEVVNLVKQKFPSTQVVFLGDESEQKTIAEICAKLKTQDGMLNLSGKTSDLLELAAIISNLNLLITTDSGPKHLAFALGVPTVTLYGASDERRWGALWDTERHIALRAGGSDLTPDELLGFPPNHQLRLISPSRVFAAVEELITRLLLV